jgi:hypothetical protein
VEWREVVRDEFGLPRPKYPNRLDGPSAIGFRRGVYTNRVEGEAQRDEINAARHTMSTGSLADQRKAGDLAFGHYGRAWLDPSGSRRQRRQPARRVRASAVPPMKWIRSTCSDEAPNWAATESRSSGSMIDARPFLGALQGRQPTLLGSELVQSVSI